MSHLCECSRCCDFHHVSLALRDVSDYHGTDQAGCRYLHTIVGLTSKQLLEEAL